MILSHTAARGELRNHRRSYPRFAQAQGRCIVGRLLAENLRGGHRFDWNTSSRPGYGWGDGSTGLSCISLNGTQPSADPVLVAFQTLEKTQVRPVSVSIMKTASS